MKKIKELFSEFRSQSRSDLSGIKNEFRTGKFAEGFLTDIGKHPHYYLFLGIMVVALLCFYICVNITHGQCYRDELCYQPADPWDDAFMDLLNMIRPVYMDNPYTQAGVSYPPINFIFTALFGGSLGEENVAHDFGPYYAGIDYYTMLEIRNSQAAMWVCIVFFLMNFIFLLSMLNRILREKGIKNIWLFDICIIFSYPCMMVIQRGNLLLLMLNFILFYFVSQSSKSKIVREVGLISLAIGIDMKLYPVILSVYLLSKKEYSKFVRLALYCIFFWLFPYAIWGGLDGIVTNIRYMFEASEGHATVNPGGSIEASALVYFVEILSGQSNEFTTALKEILPLFFLVSGILATFFLKKDWKKVLLLVCTMILFPPSSVSYNLILFFIPLVMFLIDENKTKFDYVYVLLFSMCFIHIPYVVYDVHSIGLGGSNITAGFLLLCVSFITMTLLLIGEGVFNLIRFGLKTKFKTNEDLVDTYSPVTRRLPRINIKYCTLTLCLLLGCSMAAAYLRCVLANDFEFYALDGLEFAAAILPSVIFLHMSMVFKNSELNLKSFLANGGKIISYISFYSLVIFAGSIIIKKAYNVPISFASARFFVGVILSVISAWFIHLTLNLIVKNKKFLANDVSFFVILALNILTYLPFGEYKLFNPYYLVCEYLKTGVHYDGGYINLAYQLCVYAFLTLWGVLLHVKYYSDGYRKRPVVQNGQEEG